MSCRAVRRLLAAEAGTDDDGVVRGRLRRRPAPTTRSDQPRASSSSATHVSSGMAYDSRATTDSAAATRTSPAPAHRAEAGQDRGPGILDRAGDDEHAPEVALVRPLGAGRQVPRDPALRDRAGCRRHGSGVTAVGDRHRHRHVALVRDRDGHLVEVQRLGAPRGPAVQ